MVTFGEFSAQSLGGELKHRSHNKPQRCCTSTSSATPVKDSARVDFKLTKWAHGFISFSKVQFFGEPGHIQ